MDHNGDAGPSDVVLDEAHVLAAQPRREQVLDGETGRAELIGREHETEGEDDVSQSKRQLRALHTTAEVRVCLPHFLIRFLLRRLFFSSTLFQNAVFKPRVEPLAPPTGVKKTNRKSGPPFTRMHFSDFAAITASAHL